MNLLKDNEIIVCDQRTIESIKHHVKLITVFLKHSSILTEAYILDFFVENLWSKLPLSWQDTLKDFEPCDLVALLSHEEKNSRYGKPLPLSLLAFRACAFGFSLPRKSMQSLKPIENFLKKNCSLKAEASDASSLGDVSWDTLKDEFEEKSLQHKSIPEFCRKHVKPKKQHEIFRMAQLTAMVMKMFDMKHVIDVGSGQGHLSRLLALCYDLNVATVEANQCYVSGAVNFDQQAFDRVEKLRTNSKMSRELNNDDIKKLPHHLEGSITPDSSKLYLKKIFEKAWNDSSQGYSEENFALLGLHTCGGLATTIMKLFVASEKAKVLLSIGCCYMKNHYDKIEENYPLSLYVKSLSHPLSYEAKEMACHAFEMFIKRLEDEAASLKIHCYRATLEKCILQFYPNSKHMGLRGVKNAEYLEFSEYAEKALSKVSYFIPKEHFFPTRSAGLF
ncbi:methyltransferase-like protein 25B [Uloborus diversus]|uniref:methyltransferase-like protein 25B n=1 Tax=Uloborus diversus TaxID=327109 RepID=UPI0024096C9C|nr:methyltransferase-like protein 25B [Uloborus diversus]